MMLTREENREAERLMLIPLAVWVAVSILGYLLIDTYGTHHQRKAQHDCLKAARAVPNTLRLTGGLPASKWCQSPTNQQKMMTPSGH
jgi:NADH:ubiquinone oxidoreductase subunit 6 (subunit J)